MIKKLSKYLKGLGWLCVASAAGMIIEAMCELALPSIANSVYEMVKSSTGDPTQLKYKIAKIGLLMLIMAVIGLAGGLMTMKTSSVVSQKFSYRLRKAMYDKISSFSFKNIDTFSTSSLTTRLTNDVTMLQNTVMMGLRILVRAPALLIVSAVFAFSINAKLSMILLVLFPIMIIIIAIILKFGFPMFQKMQKKIDNINRVVQENLIGIRVVKAFVREDKEKDKFHNASDELAKQGSKASGLIITVMPVMMLLMNFVIIYIYYKGSVDASKELMNVGQISVLANYIIQVLMNIMMVSMLMLQITRAKACGDRVVEVLDTDVDIVNPDNAFKPTDPKGEIEFKNVSFGYNDGIDILSDISFKAKPGSIVGIIGSTGCGKSSLVSLIPHYYDVTKGRVTVNGRDVKSVDKEELRSNIGFVMQKAVLFAGTVRDNIKWGKKDATDEEINEALRIAQVYDNVYAKEGLDTVIEQNGANLSGGQKQRLSIARAIVSKPEIIVLDDSASALDFATEKALREAILSLDYKPTLFIVSERTSSILSADKIIVLEDGQIVDVGTNEQLLKSCEVYREIYFSQFSEEEVAVGD